MAVSGRDFNEDGGVLGATVAIVGGLAVVAIAATLWIGNTTAGLAADTASCVARVNSSPDPNCGVKATTGGGNAASAGNSRPVAAPWIANFGAGSGKYDSSKLWLAERSLEIGLERFNGLKIAVYQDSQPALTRLQNAKTKAEPLAALQDLRIILTAARDDGENNPNGVSLQSAAASLAKMDHPAADTATKAQENAFKGVVPLMDAQALAVSATENYSTMTLAQLQAVGPTIKSNLAVGRDSFPQAVTSLKEGLAIIRSNR